MNRSNPLAYNGRYNCEAVLPFRIKIIENSFSQCPEWSARQADYFETPLKLIDAIPLEGDNTFYIYHKKSVQM